VCIDIKDEDTIASYFDIDIEIDIELSEKENHLQIIVEKVLENASLITMIEINQGS
jgi:hypothetical protein